MILVRPLSLINRCSSACLLVPGIFNPVFFHRSDVAFYYTYQFKTGSTKRIIFYSSKMLNTISTEDWSLSSVFSSGNYSDLALRCDGQVFNVHKVIVCSQSPVLAAAINGNRFQEAADGMIEIKEFDAETVKRMVEYLYTKTYHVSCEVKEEHNEERDPQRNSNGNDDSGIDLSSNQEQVANILVQHVRIAAIADYYDIPKLGEHARKHVENILEKSFPKDGKIFEVIDEAVFVTRDKSLASILATSLLKNLHELFKSPQPISSESLSEFEIDILAKAAKERKQLIEKYELDITCLKTQLDQKTKAYNEAKIKQQEEASRFNGIISSVDMCIQILEIRPTCKICSGPLHICTKGGFPNYQGYFVKCKNCSSQHVLRSSSEVDSYKVGSGHRR